MNPYLRKSLELGPAALERIIADIPSSRFDDRPEVDRFTLREAVAHLADFEPIFRGRMEAAYESPGIAVSPRDESQMAIDHDYASQDLFVNLEKYREERAITATFLRSLSDSDYKKVMVHSQLGEISIEDVANFLLAHDLYHVEHAAMFLSKTP